MLALTWYMPTGIDEAIKTFVFWLLIATLVVTVWLVLPTILAWIWLILPKVLQCAGCLALIYVFGKYTYPKAK